MFARSLKDNVNLIKKGHFTKFKVRIKQRFTRLHRNKVYKWGIQR